MAEESKQFSRNIWSQSADYKKDAKWLQNLGSEVNVKKQEHIDITTGSLKNILGRMPNWKSPGQNFVQGFWLKNFSPLHERVRNPVQTPLGACPGLGTQPQYEAPHDLRVENVKRSD